jgi:DNA-binding MarR family transcriptional regulator
MNMNPERTPSPEAEQYRSLQILQELANDNSLTQRDLSSRLGIALGLVNSYIKNLIKKGYITVKAIPTKRYAYYLTPTGFTEKTRLTYHMLQDYTNIYRQARKSLKTLFRDLQEQGVKTVVFAGADEVAEIAYLTLQETNLKLAGVVDTENADAAFFGNKVMPMQAIRQQTYDRIVVTSYLRRDKIYKELVKNGIDSETIMTISSV